MTRFSAAKTNLQVTSTPGCQLVLHPLIALLHGKDFLLPWIMCSRLEEKTEVAGTGIPPVRYGTHSQGPGHNNGRMLFTGWLVQTPEVKCGACLLREGDFTDAFARLGYRNPEAMGSRAAKDSPSESSQALSSQQTGEEAVKPGTFPGWQEGSPPPPLNNIQLLLRLLIRVCQQQVLFHPGWGKRGLPVLIPAVVRELACALSRVPGSRKTHEKLLLSRRLCAAADPRCAGQGGSHCFLRRRSPAAAAHSLESAPGPCGLTSGSRARGQLRLHACLHASSVSTCQCMPGSAESTSGTPYRSGISRCKRAHWS